MTDLREAAKMALEVLKQSLGYSNEAQERIKEAKQALRQALEQPEQEPVAWVYNGILHEFDPSEFATSEVKPLYTAPPCQTGAQCIGGKCPECERQWIGLTDEEIHEMIMGMRSRNMGVVMTEEIFREVEAKLKEKNGG